MPASIIDGKAIAASIREGAAVTRCRYTQKYGRPRAWPWSSLGRIPLHVYT